jgi:hypothetical protein
VRVEGDERGKEVVVIRNTNKTLDISVDCQKDCNYDLTVYVTVESLDKISCSGASSLKGEGEIKLGNLDMAVSGASAVKLSLVATNVTLDVAGASEVSLTGSAEKMKLKNKGASETDADGFKTKTADIDCAGASHASLNVSEKLNAIASGASSIEYNGSAAIGEQSITGASTLKKK